VPVFLEQAGGLNPLTTGLVMFPISVANVIMSPVAASLVTRRGTGVALVVGGSGMTVPLQTAFYQAVPADRAGTAGGQLNTLRYVGASGAAALLPWCSLCKRPWTAFASLQSRWPASPAH
jgi:hypothetical protein